MLAQVPLLRQFEVPLMSMTIIMTMTMTVTMTTDQMFLDSAEDELVDRRRVRPICLRPEKLLTFFPPGLTWSAAYSPPSNITHQENQLCILHL